jgi:hypothetical protein
MKFITTEERVYGLTFADVEEDQFFVTSHGYLAQKITSTSYNLIATPHGQPYAAHIYRCDPCAKIQRLMLPKVIKIEF